MFDLELDREPFESMRRRGAARRHIACLEQALDIGQQLTQQLVRLIIHARGAREFRVQTCQRLLEGWRRSACRVHA